MRLFLKNLFSKKASNKPHSEPNSRMHDYWKDHVKTLPNKLSAGSVAIFKSLKRRMRFGQQKKNHHEG